MAYDIARWKMHGDVLLLSNRKAIAYNMIEWEYRLTFYKDESDGKVVFAMEGPPPDNIPFVSYPIIGNYYIAYRTLIYAKWNVSDNGYYPGQIVTQLDDLAAAYGIRGSVNFLIHPLASMKMLMAYDIPLSDVNAQVSEVLGYDQRVRDRLRDEDLSGVKTYKRINIGPMVINWQYRIGNVMHNQTPKSYDSATDAYGDIIPSKIRGADENARMMEISEEITIKKKDKNERETELFMLNEIIANIEAKMSKLQDLYEDSTHDGEDEIDTYTSERQASKIRHITDMIFEELEATQDMMLLEQMNSMNKEREIEVIEQDIIILRSRLNNENKKIVDLLDKMMSYSAPGKNLLENVRSEHNTPQDGR